MFVMWPGLQFAYQFIPKMVRSLGLGSVICLDQASSSLRNSKNYFSVNLTSCTLHYQPFLESLGGVLESAQYGDSAALQGGLNAHVDRDSTTRRGNLSNVNTSGVLLLNYCVNHNKHRVQS